MAVPVTTEVTEETLGDLLDEKLSRRAVKDIQSSIKDPDRFDKWVSLLQARVDYDDPIVLPYGEGMNIVRTSDGELMIRTDAGADLCRWDQNWKLHAPMFVRDTDALYREVYPELGHPDGDWQELREFYCPVSGRLLETEAVPPGLPGRARVPAGHRGVLQGLAGAGAARLVALPWEACFACGRRARRRLTIRCRECAFSKDTASTTLPGLTRTRAALLMASRGWRSSAHSKQLGDQILLCL